jgi:hypothetical protein
MTESEEQQLNICGPHGLCLPTCPVFLKGGVALTLWRILQWRGLKLVTYILISFLSIDRRHKEIFWSHTDLMSVLC